MTTFALAVAIPANPSTQLRVGQICSAYRSSRFADAVTVPATNTAAPSDGSGPDAGPHVSDVNGVLLDVPAFGAYFVSYYDPADTSNSGTYNLYWTG